MPTARYAGPLSEAINAKGMTPYKFSNLLGTGVRSVHRVLTGRTRDFHKQKWPKAQEILGLTREGYIELINAQHQFTRSIRLIQPIFNLAVFRHGNRI